MGVPGASAVGSIHQAGIRGWLQSKAGGSRKVSVSPAQQRAAFQTTKAATQIGAAAAQHLRHIDAAGEGEPGAGAAVRCAQAQGAAGKFDWATAVEREARSLSGIELR